MTKAKTKGAAKIAPEKYADHRPVKGDVPMLAPGCPWEFGGVIGLSTTLCVFDGDCAVGHASDLGDGEAAALGNYMIDLWTRFRDEDRAVTNRPSARDAYNRANAMESPLDGIRNFAGALCRIADTLDDDDGAIVSDLALRILGFVGELDEIHEFFFRLHHP
jgi:hypothetical protein